MGSSSKEIGLRSKATAEAAISCIGFGYDITEDLRLKYCKKESQRLISIDDDQVCDIVIPGGIVIPNVSKKIHCDKGERMQFSSDCLPFQQMSEKFNGEVSLSSRIPTGHFNAAFEFTGSWHIDAANTKALALDGVSITIYSIALDKPQIILCDHIKEAVPVSWNPTALARFIEKFGTHVIVGVKMGGKDMVYMKQQYSSTLQPDEVQKRLKNVADERFRDASGHRNNSKMLDGREMLEVNKLKFVDTRASSSYLDSEGITFICRRRGGSNKNNLLHEKWCQSVRLEPDVISMSFIPISSLLSGVNGNGFLTHAINLYLRYKPPVEELCQFLEFQRPRQWAPVFGELAVGPDRTQESAAASLQFSFLGPKLCVNTILVDSAFRPVTGMRLHLEGKKGNCLAIHLQHLSSLPESFQLQEEPAGDCGMSNDRRYYEKVQSKSFSHVCTAPVESDNDHSIVTGAQFEVTYSFGKKRILFLHLHFSKVIGATVVKQPEWDGSPVLGQKSGILSNLLSGISSSTNEKSPRPSDVNINSAVYPGGPPVSAQSTKLLRFVDTTEITRGPSDLPGYWAVSGAKLGVDGGKINLSVKYSLVAVTLPEEMVLE